MRLVELSGKTFGYLLVICRAEGNFAKPRWLCKCKCGKNLVVRGSDLRLGKSKSCGCYHVEKITKHGKSKSSTYASWISMIQRCENPKSEGFDLYGGRGITVCCRWRKSFELFLVDMGERPKGKSLDRKNINKGYYPKNCKWSTPKQQANNRRSCIYITYKGKTKTISQWARYFGVVEISLRSRLRKGWSVKKAFETPYK
jgi:hypothetical protein